jgi:arylformamidase
MNRRVQFDFSIRFANGGGLEGHEFRLDIPGASISDDDLARLIVADLNLLMVGQIEIRNKSYVDEPHKRTRATYEGIRLVELSHRVHDGMTTYPGLPGPAVSTFLSRDDSQKNYAPGTTFHIGRVDMIANTGTYLDAPFHRHADGPDVSQLALEQLVDVPAVLVDATTRRIDADAFTDAETWGRAVIIRTGWSRWFGTSTYVGAHPHLTSSAADRLVDGGAVLVGIDSANIDSTDDGERPVHTTLLAAGIPIIEHLTGLDALSGAAVMHLTAVPAPISGMGTFPVRVVARVS